MKICFTNQTQIDHPNVVKLYEIFETEEKLYLVLDLLTGYFPLSAVFESKFRW